MKRATFLKGVATGIATLATGKLPVAEAKPVAEVKPVAMAVKSIKVTPLVSSGGLCAPLSQIYDLPSFPMTKRPICEALPSITATRGGVV